MLKTDLSLELDPKLRPREPGSSFPPTASQLRTWRFRADSADLNSTRMCVGAFHVNGTLDAAFVRLSLESICLRHESLRARFAPDAGGVVLDVSDCTACRFSIIDITHSEGDPKAHAKRLAEDFLSEKVSLSVGPLFASRLFKLDETEHVLVIALDHVLTDGHSNMLLIREFWSIYHQFHIGRPTCLPDLQVQFGDYSRWHNETQASWLARHGSYWSNHFDAVPPTEIPADHSSTAVTASSEMLHFIIPRSVSDALRDVSTREGIMLPILLLTVLSVVMSEWCGRTEFAISFVVNGRHGVPELETMVGFLASWLYLRIHIHPNDSLSTLSLRLADEFRSAWEHYDFGRAPDLVPKKITEISFNWSNRMQRAKDRQLDGSPLRVLPFPLGMGWGFKFIPFFYDTPAGIGVTVDYRPDLLEHSTIRRFADRIKFVAKMLAEQPCCALRTGLRVS